MSYKLQNVNKKIYLFNIYLFLFIDVMVQIITSAKHVILQLLDLIISKNKMLEQILDIAKQIAIVIIIMI